MDDSRSRRRQRGSAFVELAVALPVVIVVFILAADFARAFYTGIELTHAARAGAMYGAWSVLNSEDVVGMKSTAEKSVNITDVTATASRVCGCIVATSFGSLGSCFAPSRCTANFHRILAVKVNVTTTFHTVMRFPGLPNSLPMSRTVVMRVAE